MSNAREPGPTTVGRAAIFAAVLRRQALRREAHLPLLNVRAEYDRAVKHALWTAHVQQHQTTVREVVLAELRERLGPQFGYSVGGLWTVRVLTVKRLKEMLNDII